jgi:DNA helicase HerA-like ATPase
MIAFDGTLEERFGCPDEDAGLFLGDLLKGHAKGPRRESLAGLIERRYLLRSA